MSTKGLTKSVTLWGGSIVAIAVLILPVLGFGDLAAVLQGETAGIQDWLALAAGLVGNAMVFYGRVRKAGGQRLVIGG